MERGRHHASICCHVVISAYCRTATACIWDLLLLIGRLIIIIPPLFRLLPSFGFGRLPIWRGKWEWITLCFCYLAQDAQDNQYSMTLSIQASLHSTSQPFSVLAILISAFALPIDTSFGSIQPSSSHTSHMTKSEC